MKLKTFLGALCSTWVISSCTTTDSTTYTITVNLEGAPDSVNVQFIPVSHDSEPAIIDTALVNGKIILKGSVEEPLAVRMLLKGSYGGKMMMLENKNIKITGSIKTNMVGENLNYNYSDITVTGSPLTDKYIELYSVRNKLDSLYNANSLRFKEFNDASVLASNTKNQAMMDSLKNSPLWKAREEADKDFFKTVGETYNALFEEHKNTFWGPLMLITLTSWLSEDQKTTYESFSEEVKNSYYGKKVKEELYPVGLVGSTMPDFSINNQKGEEVTLYQHFEGKKYILIDFWASWCAPCRKEIPHLKELYKAYGAKGFEIVSVSIDKKESDWTKALKEENLAWPNFLDEEGRVAGLYKVKFVPTMYLVDSDGVMIGENLRGDELAEKVRELFN